MVTGGRGAVVTGGRDAVETGGRGSVVTGGRGAVVTGSAPLRPGSCLLPQVSDLNRFIDYHLRVYVEILPKSRGVTRRVRDELSHPHAQ